MRKIIILNGCPGSGKDTVSEYICKKYNYKSIAFKDGAFELVYNYYNLSKDEYMSLYNDRSLKEKPSDKLDNKSPRKAMQYVVEEVYKKKYGRDFLAKKIINQIKNDKSNNYVISDLGLDEEEISVHYHLRNEDYMIIYIDRDGYTFENDTRSKRQIIHRTITNNSTLEDLYKQIDNIILEQK